MKNTHVNHFLVYKYVFSSTCKFGFILVPSQGLWAPRSGWCPVVSCICRVFSPPDFQVDFDQLQDNLCQMERRCKASWDHLKAIAKHEMKPVLKQRMSEFLKDCAERIIILKIVHRRIINRCVCAEEPTEKLKITCTQRSES